MRVQVVDDHEQAARGLSVLLEGDDIEFLEPVESVSDVSIDADVVVCDLVLKGQPLWGFEAIQYLDGLNLPVVSTSALAKPSSVAAAIAANASAFIHKDGPFSRSQWERTLHAAAQHTRTISPRLAEILLADAQERPLPASHEFTRQDKDFLLDVMRDADSPFAEKTYDWRAKQVLTITRHVWSCTLRRHESWKLQVDPNLRRAAPLLRLGVKQEIVAKELNIPVGTLSRLLSNLRGQVTSTHKGTYWASNDMDRTETLLRLLDLEEDEEELKRRTSEMK